MSLPTSESVPDDQANLPPARRRRENRLIIPLEADERAHFLDELAQRTIPSFDFFLFTALAGLALAAAILVDSPALYLLVALLAPFMAPVIGLSLATILGSGRLFLQTLSGTLLGSLVVFLIGLLTGWALRWLPSLPVSQASLHTQLSWPDFAILTLGVILIIYMMVRTEQKPLVPGIILAYELYIPVGLAGFGLSSGIAHLWPDGLLVFLVHLTWITLLGTVVLAFLGFRPLTLFGYTLGTTITLIGLVLAIGLSLYGTAEQTKVALPTGVPSETPTITITDTITETVETPTAPPILTPFSTDTLEPTMTYTVTFTPAPTQVWALINSATGANMRSDPKADAQILTVIDNGALVEVLSETVADKTVVWVHIRYKNVEGWIWQSLLTTATPAPGW
jgi:hypothetical protein